MKSKNFLSNLWSRVAGSQRNDVEFDRRLTVGSPSGFTINWTLKLVSVLVLVLSLGSGNVWGATETLTMSEMGWDNASTQSSIPASSATIALAQNSGSTPPTYYTSDGLRIYGVKSANTGGTIAFTAVDEITQIQFTHTAQNSGVLSIKSGGGSYSSKKWTGTLTAGNTLTLVATNSGTKAPQVRITEIAITYKAKVTFNANGGSCATASLTQSTPTSTITLPTPTRADFTCTGWYTASSGGTKRGNAGATYTPSASETLYAQWESSASCADPSAPGTSSVSGTSATITVGTSGNYNIYYSTSSTAPSKATAGTTTISSGTSVNLTGLPYGTTYYYWAQKDCGGGSKSNYVAGNPTSFTTTVPTPTGLSAGSISMNGVTFTITDASSVNNYEIYYSKSSSTPGASPSGTVTSTSKTKEVTGLESGQTYYCWVRAKGTNTNSSWYSGGSFTTLTLNSISVSTAPTKTKYLEGENFDPTGLVITRTYSNSTSNTYTYAGHTSEFTFAPATNTALTTSNTSVTITYGGKTTTQSINVYTVTVNKVNMSGTAITNASVTASCSGRTLSQSVGSTNYKFNSWNVTAGGVSVSSNSITGTPTGNVTINAKFHDPITVAWKVGSGAASGSPTTEVKYGAKITALPSTPADNALGACATKFMGWSKSNLGSDEGQSAPSDLFTSTSDAGVTALTSATTYYAVFASGSYGAAVGTTLFEEPFTGFTADTKPTSPGSYATVYGGATITYTFTNGTGTSSGTTVIKDEALTNSGATPEVMVGKKGTSTGATGGTVVISGIPTGEASALTVSYTQNGNALSAAASGTGYSGNTSGSSKADKSFDVTIASGAASTFTLTFTATSTSNVRLDDIKVVVKTRGTVFSNYVTKCCAKHDITLASDGTATGGEFIVDPESACDGTSIEILATPSVGYNFGSWSIYKTETPATTITPASSSSESTTFTMPDYAVTVDASFTAKTYSITLDKNGGSSDGSATATYNSGVLTSISAPSYAGYVLVGYYAAADGDTKVADDNGTLVANVTGYTDADGNWNYDGAKKLYAHWVQDGTYRVTITPPTNGSISVTYTDMGTALTSGYRDIDENTILTITATGSTGYHLGSLTVGGSPFTSGNTHKLTGNITIAATFAINNYSVTWMVNGVEWSDKGGSSDVNHGSRISALPTVPDSEDFCGDTFVGWTTEASYEHGTSPLYTSESGFPNATGNQTFYAVFADYTE